MDNSANLSRKIREQSKNYFMFFYVESVLFISWMVLTFVSSLMLNNEYYYYKAVQIINLILCPLTTLLFAAVFYQNFQAKVLQKRDIIIILALSCFKIVIQGLTLFNLIASISNYQCGYFINHSGDVDGLTIVNDIQSNENIPTCTEMEYYFPELSVYQQLMDFSWDIILQECNGNTSCISKDTLVIEKWMSVFELSIFAVSIGCFITLTFPILMKLMVKKQVEVRNRLLKKQLINKK